MKKHIFLLLTSLFLLPVLVTCGAEQATTAVSVAADPAFDLATLPDEINAQTVAAIQERDDVFLIDVREPEEYDAGHIPGITLIPMNEVAARLGEIPTDKKVILTCRSGNRSGQVAQFLREQGYDNVHNMQGGILAWQAAGFPVEK